MLNKKMLNAVQCLYKFIYYYLFFSVYLKNAWLDFEKKQQIWKMLAMIKQGIMIIFVTT
jgi:hypothetical protein